MNSCFLWGLFSSLRPKVVCLVQRKHTLFRDSPFLSLPSPLSTLCGRESPWSFKHTATLGSGHPLILSGGLNSGPFSAVHSRHELRWWAPSCQRHGFCLYGCHRSFLCSILTCSTGRFSVETKGPEVAEEWPLSAHSFSPLFHSFVTYGFRHTPSTAV